MGRVRIAVGLVAVVTAALLAVPAHALASAQEPAADDGVELVYFRSETCPVCVQQADPWLDDLAERYPELTIHRVEVTRDRAARELFVEMMAARGEEARAVPAFVLGDEAWVGLGEATASAIEQRVAAATADPEPDAGPDPEPTPVPDEVVGLGPLGAVDLDAQPMLAATVLIGLVDGFNPCSLWVLTVLLAMVLHSRSRARIAMVGGAFLTVTAAIYGLFIAGVFTALAVVAHVRGVQVAVALLALAIAAISLKDFVAFRRGVSLSIPERAKPGILRRGRRLRDDLPLPALLGATVVLAAGVAIVELPCTAGLPLVWSGLVADAGVSGAGFASLLAAYLGTYLAVEIAIVVVALVTLRATRLQEVHGRRLKLVGGVVMAALGLALLVEPAVMASPSGSLGVIGAALAAAAAGVLLDLRRTARAGG